MRTALTTALALITVSTFATEPDRKIPPITELKVATTPAVFDAAKRLKPIELKTAKDAANYFKPDALETLEEKVDFDQQVVLIFAWKGGAGGSRTGLQAALPQGR